MKKVTGILNFEIDRLYELEHSVGHMTCVWGHVTAWRGGCHFRTVSAAADCRSARAQKHEAWKVNGKKHEGDLKPSRHHAALLWRH